MAPIVIPIASGANIIIYLMDLINISNHPSDSTIKRKANRAGIITDEHNAYELKYVNLNVLVKHFKEEIAIYG